MYSLVPINFCVLDSVSLFVKYAGVPFLHTLQNACKRLMVLHNGIKSNISPNGSCLKSPSKPDT